MAQVTKGEGETRRSKLAMMEYQMDIDDSEMGEALGTWSRQVLT